MILRSPAENVNGGISFHRVPSSTRHSRPVEYGPKLHGGNPGLLRRISLDTRFRGYDGTKAGLFVLIPKRVFSKEVTKSTKLRSLEISMSETFVSFLCFVVKSVFLFLVEAQPRRLRSIIGRAGAVQIFPPRQSPREIQRR